MRWKLNLTVADETLWQLAERLPSPRTAIEESLPDLTNQAAIGLDLEDRGYSGFQAEEALATEQSVNH